MKSSVWSSLRLLVFGGTLFALDIAAPMAMAQIGQDNLQLSLDNVSVYNGSGNVTGAPVIPGTSLTGTVSVLGATGNGGTTSVVCTADNASTGDQINIFSTSTSVTLTGAQFTWTPSAFGTYTVSCSANYSGLHVNGTAITGDITIAANGPTSILYPAYKVTSIIYSAPGSKSSDRFTTSTTDGTTTSIGNSFTAGSTTTYTSGGDFLGAGGTLSVDFGASATTGNSTALTETFTDGTGVALTNQATNPNAINHGQDLFIVWLNPAVSITPTGATTADYSIGTQSASDGTLERVDQVEVTAGDMVGVNGVSSVPAAVLNPQYDSNGNPTLPGLAAVCANLNLSEYDANQCTLQDQCGCKPSDFAEILTSDPLLNYSATTTPLNADTSGATECANPQSTDKCRYIPVPATPGSTQQEVELLAGPECSGCDTPVNSFTQSDSSTKTQTQSESYSETVGYSWKTDLLDISGGPSLTNSKQFTWTDTESSGATNGSANSMGVSLSSSTVGCYEDILVFEDTLYHTFVFQQPANNTSCNP